MGMGKLIWLLAAIGALGTALAWSSQAGRRSPSPAAPVAAAPMELTLDPAATRIEFTLGATFHTVHGSFTLHEGNVHYDPGTGQAGGLIVVNAASGTTGNADRDANMHNKVLQVARYPEITFTPTRVLGALPGPGRYTAEVEGILRLHGADHQLRVPVAVVATAERLTARAQVTIPYVRWGLKDPSTFFLHVAKQAQFQLFIAGSLHPAR